MEFEAGQYYRMNECSHDIFVHGVSRQDEVDIWLLVSWINREPNNGFNKMVEICMTRAFADHWFLLENNYF